MIVAVVIAAAVVVGAFLAWNAFFRHDDAADIQGEWRTQDNSMIVVIDGSNIRMPDLEYPYEIDTGTKTITFSFSDLTGSGSYSFSDDRNTLTIVEGEGDSAATTVFVKVSDNTQATPRLLEGSTGSEESGDANADESKTSGAESASDSDGASEVSGDGDAQGDGSSSEGSGQ